MQLSNHTIWAIIILAVIILLLVWFFIRRARRTTQQSNEGEQIYIGNLPYRTSEADLQKRFSRFGNIENVRIVKDRRTGRSKGYAFVTFSNSKEAKKSLSAHGKELSGRSLVVHIAKPR